MKDIKDEAEFNKANKQQRQQLKTEKHKVLKKLRNLLKFKKTAEMDEELKVIEAYKVDPSKYYKAMRKVNS